LIGDSRSGAFRQVLVCAADAVFPLFLTVQESHDWSGAPNCVSPPPLFGQFVGEIGEKAGVDAFFLSPLLILSSFPPTEETHNTLYDLKKKPGPPLLRLLLMNADLLPSPLVLRVILSLLLKTFRKCTSLRCRRSVVFFAVRSLVSLHLRPVLSDAQAYADQGFSCAFK